MAPSQSKMSIAAQFDDACRIIAAMEEGLDDTLRTFLTFVLQQDECRKQWMGSARSAVLGQHRMLDDENAKRIHNLNSVIAGLKADLQYEQEKNNTLENKVAELQQIVNTVQRLVSGDNMPSRQQEIVEYLSRFPNAQTACKSRDDSLDADAVLFDKTDDDLDLDDNMVKQRRPSGKRSGRTEGGDHTSPKRQKSGELLVECNRETSVIATTKVTIPPSRGNIVAESKIETVPSQPTYNLRSRRSSDSWVQIDAPSAPPLPPSYNVLSYENAVRRASQTPAPSPSVHGTPFRQCISTSKLNKRQHHFATKTVIRPETCSPCGRKIKFYKQALKCAECRTTCHPECKAQVPVVCIPVSHTPTGSSRSLTVADYAPTESPMVPALIVHCVNELESRGMKETGLYRISGSDKEIKELKAKILKGKGPPSLAKIDVHVICGVLKDFLRSFETIVPRTMWHNFVHVLEISDVNDSICALYQVISQLPPANRDTLAFLIAHWQRISETPEIKMPVRNLATILAPTIVGYSMATLPENTIKEELPKITMVMEKLLNIPSDYWNRILNPEVDNVFRTPDIRPAPEGSLLGPVTSNGTWNLRSRSVLMGRTPLSPRAGYGGSLKSGRNLFGSPVLR